MCKKFSIQLGRLSLVLKNSHKKILSKVASENSIKFTTACLGSGISESWQRSMNRSWSAVLFGAKLSRAGGCLLGADASVKSCQTPSIPACGG